MVLVSVVLGAHDGGGGANECVPNTVLSHQKKCHTKAYKTRPKNKQDNCQFWLDYFLPPPRSSLLTLLYLLLVSIEYPNCFHMILGEFIIFRFEVKLANWIIQLTALASQKTARRKWFRNLHCCFDFYFVQYSIIDSVPLPNWCQIWFASIGTPSINPSPQCPFPSVEVTQWHTWSTTPPTHRGQKTIIQHFSNICLSHLVLFDNPPVPFDGVFPFPQFIMC